MMNFKRPFLFALVISFFALPAVNAEIVFLNNGKIYIGDIISATPEGIEYSFFGRNVVVQPKDIHRTDQDLGALSAMKVDIILVDGSTLHGTISDFDPEIGLFYDLSFGRLTLPSASIGEIVDPARKTLFEGTNFGAGIRGVYYWPIGSITYLPSFIAGISVETKTGLFRGFFAGIDFDYVLMDYSGSDSLAYSIYQVTPKAIFKLLTWRTATGFLSLLVPYAEAGLGASFISVSDSRPGVYPNRYGDLTLNINGELGLGFSLPLGLSIRAGCKYMGLVQSETLFNSVGVALSATYEF